MSAVGTETVLVVGVFFVTVDFVIFFVAGFFHAMTMFGLRNINDNTEKTREYYYYPLCGVSCFLPFALLLANTLLHAFVSILALNPCVCNLLCR